MHVGLRQPEERTHSGLPQRCRNTAEGIGRLRQAHGFVRRPVPGGQGYRQEVLPDWHITRSLVGSGHMRGRKFLWIIGWQRDGFIKSGSVCMQAGATLNLTIEITEPDDYGAVLSAMPEVIDAQRIITENGLIF